MEWDCDEPQALPSPLTEGRGLKSFDQKLVAQADAVAPYGGAWIEICSHLFPPHFVHVAPHGGAWIEIRTGR